MAKQQKRKTPAHTMASCLLCCRAAGTDREQRAVNLPVGVRTQHKTYPDRSSGHCKIAGNRNQERNRAYFQGPQHLRI